MSEHHPVKKSFLKQYKPLWIILAISLAAGFVVNDNPFGPHASALHDAMGFFLIFLSFLKFLDVGGFVKQFVQYDWVTQHFTFYGWFYPWIELVLGLGYLSHEPPVALYWVTLGFAALNLKGVIQGIQQRNDLHCACMGSFVKVPLSTISILENMAMGIMAAWMLLV